MISPDTHTYTETENEYKFNAKQYNKDGFKINISFTKNKEEHDESIKVIKEFFVREIF
jgi:hypothetical protein